MTDREPDDLYDALRDRLADHGQEPPATLWAGIRAQLPPPVAPPQLRRRKRRAALLALLLLVVSAGSWLEWRVSQKLALNGAAATIASSNSPTSTSSAAVATKEYPAHAASATPSNSANSSDKASDKAAEPATASAAPSAGANSVKLAPNATGNHRNPAAAAASPTATPVNAAETAAAVKPGFPAGTGKYARAKPGRQPAMVAAARLADGSRRRSGRHLLAAATEAAPRPTQAQAHRKQPADYVDYPKAAGMSGAKNSRATSAAAADNLAVLAGQRRHYSPLKTVPAPSASTAGPTPAAGAARYALARQRPARLHQPTPMPAGPTPGPEARTTKPGERLPAPETAAVLPSTLSFAEYSLMQPRPVALPQRPWAAPTVQAVADTAPHLPAAGGRWNLQVLAGPAVTYRLLGSTLPASASPISNAAFYDRSGAATSIPAQERAAIGYGAQVRVRRALSGRWTVSTGLGYHEYATSLNLKTVALPAGTSPIGTTVGTFFPDSGQVRTVHLRDTYRFLTVPVRFGYQLGAGGRHLRLGLLAGADLAWYLGGATTESSTCGCETKAWGLSGSPYRPLSLSLNLGIDLRYRLAPRWELLAQPTATLFLNSLARPNTGFVPRYLLGGSTLLGVSYGLH